MSNRSIFKNDILRFTNCQKKCLLSLDINECTVADEDDGSPVCFPEGIATCINQIPGFTCGCEHGYNIDDTGVNCIGIPNTS